jgi:DNA sulfur modification protein DndB
LKQHTIGGKAAKSDLMTGSFEYQFPAIRGIQAGREYYVSMCPLRLIPKIFLFDEEELVPELRAQRILNKARIPEMADYVTGNRENYVFSAITASIDGIVNFDPLAEGDDLNRIGTLHVPMESRFIINDGQHRRAAIEMALKEQPEVGDETIAVVFFLDRGLERCQQMFADLNRYAIRPSTSLGLLYDHRDAKAQLAKAVVSKSSAFNKMVEMEKSSLSARSRKLFTLSAVYNATSALIGDQQVENVDELAEHCAVYWDEVDKYIPEWRYVRESKMTSGEVRRDFIHSHAITLQVLGEVGHMLMQQPKTWKQKLVKLSNIDWSRSNSSLWEGRAMVAGRVQKARNNVTLTRAAVKSFVGLPFTPEEQRLEDALGKGEYDVEQRAVG